MTEIVWDGPEELRAFLRPIGDVRPHAQNPRRGDIAIVRTSLQAFGQQKPIITDRDDHDLIVAGNHTYLAARSVGWTHVAVIEMWEGADEGARYLLMDNRTSDSSSYDRQELLALLDAYHSNDLEATGYTEAEREQLRQELAEERQAAAEFAAGQQEEEPQPVPGTEVRNLLVKLDPEPFEKFATKLQVLKREWGIVGNSEVVAEAVRREALRLHQETE